MSIDVRDEFDELMALLGASGAVGTAEVQGRPPAVESEFDGDQATFGATGSELARMAADGDVRMEKVVTIQAALEAGTYTVPAKMVAAKLLDAIFAGERKRAVRERRRRLRVGHRTLIRGPRKSE